MYTTVPAQSAVSLLTDCIVHCFGLTAADIHQLLSIIVDNTYFSFHDNIYKQTTGFPMGSSLSCLLAITYMNHLEHRALIICRSCAFFTRYVDDILILTSSHEEADRIFTMFNNMDIKIQFTLEHPNNTGSLSLLDFQLKITEEEEIHTEFYRKAASRDMFVQYSSALSLGVKIGYARN
ncbi:uncharacterized protein LOC106871340 [Octopus bimaculoides]|uniref:uncharacterized protein LOC106871340 n=1 Tax=Octopus bimaculoides TaxID=37653 RepID=UPI00071C3FE7|nr:uncharacterized protein LOC106871340 [Octopus bimaculoides]|eukprot:XP_014773228.1 PREDICTED: uncharacterized protein LOC106871340 [Octopus bimaculoides]